jgi:hypothetical protein
MTHSPAAPALSFIVPVRNDAVRLQRCLDTIRANDSSVAPTEIVVVDNGSSDGSADVARSRGARVIVLPGERVSALRNTGARAAAGALLAFVDADHELAPGWTRAAVGLFEDATIGAAGAQYHAPADGTWVQRTYDRLRRRHPGRRTTDWLPSGNIIVRRTAFESVAGFDTSLVTCEDVDFCHRLRSNGWRLLEADDLRSVHHGDPRTLPALFRGELWRGQDNLRVSWRGRGGVRDLPSALSPIAMLAALSSLAVGIAAWPLGTWWPLMAGVALLASLVATRTVSLIRRTPRLERGVSSFIQAMIVGGVYDAARAWALVVRPPHDVRLSSTAGSRSGRLESNATATNGTIEQG